MARNKHPEQTIERIVDAAFALFVEKGYENTSIQDIIDHLGGLSKGAIYHHFKSKEEIFNAVAQKIDRNNEAFYAVIRDDASLNGLQKLHRMFESAISNPNQEAIAAMSAHILAEPKFVIRYITEILDLVSPHFIQPILEEGMRDGSIPERDDVREITESLLLLCNLWCNPLLRTTTPGQLERQFLFIQKLYAGLGFEPFPPALIKQLSQRLVTLYQQNSADSLL